MAASVWSASNHGYGILSPKLKKWPICTKASVRPPGGILRHNLSASGIYVPRSLLYIFAMHAQSIVLTSPDELSSYTCPSISTLNVAIGFNRFTTSQNSSWVSPYYSCHRASIHQKWYTAGRSSCVTSSFLSPSSMIRSVTFLIDSSSNSSPKLFEILTYVRLAGSFPKAYHIRPKTFGQKIIAIRLLLLSPSTCTPATCVNTFSPTIDLLAGITIPNKIPYPAYRSDGSHQYW